MELQKSVKILFAGLIGNSSFLKYTSPVFEGSFVVLWAILFWKLLRKNAV